MLEKRLKQIPQRKLIKGRYYLGRGRNSNIGYWNGDYFLTMGFKFNQPSIKFEPYYSKKAGCFQPFKLLDEGRIAKPVGRNGWEKHYGKALVLKLD